MIFVLVAILVILCIMLIIGLIDSIIEKYFCSMLKYRIVKVKEGLSTKYIIQRRFLWFFWIYVCGYSTNLYTLKEVKSEIEKIKLIKRRNKKEVVVLYKE